MILDDLARTLLRGSSVALFVTALAQGLGFAVQVLLARLLGGVDYGFFSYGLAWLSVGLVLGKIGFDTGLVRFVAQYAATGEWTMAHQVVRHARRTTLLAATLVAAVGGCAVLVARPEPAGLHATLLVTALVLPVAVYSEITAAAVRGLRKVGVALIGDGVVRPFVVAAIVLVMWRHSERALAATAMFAYLAGTVASIALTRFVLHKSLPQTSTRADTGLPSLWTATALPMMLASGFLTMLYAVDTLMLGWLADTTVAGYYSVASKVALLVLFAMNAAQTMAAPMLSGAFSSGRREDVTRIVVLLNGLSAAAAIPLTVLIVVAAAPILGVFGSEFREATVCLQLLALMQVINALTGPVGTLLTMTGHQNALVALLGGGLALNVVLNILLIPPLGATGAALAALLSHTAWNLLGVFVVRRRLDIDCSIMAVLRLRPGRG